MREEGIDLELTEVDSGALGIAALVSGGVQLVDADPFQLVQLLKQGKSVQFIYNLTKGVTLDMVFSKDVVAAKKLTRSMPIASGSQRSRASGSESPSPAPQPMSTCATMSSGPGSIRNGTCRS